MGLAILILGLALFLGAHIFVSRRAERAKFIGKFGEKTYKWVISLVSVAGLLVIGWGFGLYRATGWIDVWYPPSWTRHVTAALVWPAIICIAAAFLQGRIKRTLKHPMIVGVKLWALAHLISNGDLGSIILFGSILAWAVYDRISFKYRTDDGASPLAGALPAGMSETTKDVLAVAIGTLVYLALGLWFHPHVIGVPAFGR
jgi:uncharacterized membrane protein